MSVVCIIKIVEHLKEQHTNCMLPSYIYMSGKLHLNISVYIVFIIFSLKQ